MVGHLGVSFNLNLTQKSKSNIKIHSETLIGEQKAKVLSRGVDMTMERANYSKKKQMEYLNSELSF